MMLVSMGFSEFAAQRSALGCGNKGVAEAQEWAFKHMEDADFNSPLDAPAQPPATPNPAPTAAPSAAVTADVAVSAPLTPSAATMSAPAVPAPACDEAVVAQLLSTGFSEWACRRACLATGSDADAALEWIIAHMDDPELNTAIGGDSPESGPAGMALDGEDRSSVKRDSTGQPKPPSPEPSAVAPESAASVFAESAPAAPAAPVASAAPAASVAPAASAAPAAPSGGFVLDFDFSSLGAPAPSASASQIQVQPLA